MKTRNDVKAAELNLDEFYEAMEEDTELLESSFETLLQMVVSTDKSGTESIALLIKYDYPDLFKTILKLAPKREPEGNKPICCHSIV